MSASIHSKVKHMLCLQVPLSLSSKPVALEMILPCRAMFSLATMIKVGG